MKNKLGLIVTLITVSIFLFTTVGYAVFNKNLGIGGTVTFKSGGEIAITNVVLNSYSNLTNPQDPEFDADSITFDLRFNVESNSNLDDDYQAVYEITLSNASFFDYEFASAVFNPDIETINNPNMTVTYDVVGIEIGEIIPKLTTKTFTLIINMYPTQTGEYSVGGDSNINVEQEEIEEPQGSLLASIPKNSSVNLRNGNVRDSVTLTVANSFDTAQGFSLSINNSNFKLVDSNGNSLGNISIPANTTQTYDIYFQQNSSSMTFATDYQTANLIFSKSGGNLNLGSVKILVDKDETLLDSDAPIISDVSASFVAENGKVALTWSATDINNITGFIVDVCDSNDSCTSYNTGSSSRNYTATGLSNGSYYFKVYGIDSKGNNGKSQATTCTTSEGKCSRSTSTNYKWVFSVTYNIDSYVTKTSGPTSVVINDSFSASFTIDSGREIDQMSTTMGGRTLTNGSNGYSWNANRGNMSISSVTGDIIINITTKSSGWCLVEGTKILLSNGKYKNIENIGYNDLLSVWSYDTGKITYEYPIWIEKTSKTSSYQKNTFSDGTILNTVGYHGIFSSTYNQFISVDDYSKFKVGTKVYKIENNELKEVEVIKIEKINKVVNYYHVVSARYYNIIANNLLTTDGTVILSNLYGFDKNVTWPKSIRNNIVSNKDELYKYKDFSDIMPYYMFDGLRVEEGKYLNNYGLDLLTFRYYLINNQLNDKMLLNVPTDAYGKRLWMVTTSEDKIINKKDYLYKEGDYYTLPANLNVKYWYSTSENKYYKPLEKVKVNHSMHFIAKKILE